jgi:hypothetical protein
MRLSPPIQYKLIFQVVKVIVFSTFTFVNLQASKNPIPRDKNAAIKQAIELKLEVDEDNRIVKELYGSRANSIVSNFDENFQDKILEDKPKLKLQMPPIVSKLTEEDFKFIKREINLPHDPLPLPESEKHRYEIGGTHVK